MRTFGATWRRRCGPTWRLALAAGASVLAAGCGDSADSAASGGAMTTTVDTVGSWVRVVNSGAAPEWELAPVASIGPGLGDVEAMPGEFGQAVSVALSPGEDAVYVADRQNCEVRVFGPDGAHLRTFGRCGEGPGEFSPFFYSIAWAGDKLLAFDFGGGRIGEFTSEGEWLGQRRALGVGAGAPHLALYPVGDGVVYALSLTGDQYATAYVGQDAAGETSDTVARLPPPEDWGALTCVLRSGPATVVNGFDNIYAPHLLQHPGPGGTLYSAMSDEYRIAVTRGGDTLRVIERDLPPEPVADEEWDALSQEFEALMDEMPGASCEPHARPQRPAQKPFMKGFFFDATGRLWVEVVRTAGNRWELFDTDGRLLAQVPAGPRKEGVLPALGARHAATIRQDSLDLDHVDIWRIEAPGR